MSPTRRYTIHPPQLVGRLSPPGPSAELPDAMRQLIADYDAAMQELQRWLRYMADANDTGQEGAGIVGVVDGTVDHGSIAGLADDDHAQYLKEKGSGGLAAEVPIHDHSGAGGAGQVDHGVLTGLADDDHTQYQLRSEKAAASGYASLDASSLVVQQVKVVRQGLAGALPALAEGELYWATDTDTLYIGT